MVSSARRDRRDDPAASPRVEPLGRSQPSDRSGGGPCATRAFRSPSAPATRGPTGHRRRVDRARRLGRGPSGCATGSPRDPSSSSFRCSSSRWRRSAPLRVRASRCPVNHDPDLPSSSAGRPLPAAAGCDSCGTAARSAFGGSESTDRDRSMSLSPSQRMPPKAPTASRPSIIDADTTISRTGTGPRWPPWETRPC